MFKVFGFAALAITVLAAGATSYRSYRQHRVAASLAIDTVKGINESGYVSIGGVDQWVQVRGHDRKNPTLLVIHGGPGMSYVPFTPWFTGWEEHFTVVLWDRQGVGKTYAKNGEPPAGTLSFERFSNEGIELVEHLKQRLSTGKVILLGHSVGSFIGVMMVKKRPDLFFAYVGTDQIVDMARNEEISYQMLLTRAEASGDSSLMRSVRRAGAPPYRTGDEWLRKQQLVSATDPLSKSFENKLFPMIMTAPGYSMSDMMAFGKGLKYSANALVRELMDNSLYPLGLEFQVPLVMILGEKDVIVPVAPAVEYFNDIKAPSKELVLLPGTPHGAMLMQPDLFLTKLLNHVRPLAIPATPLEHKR